MRDHKNISENSFADYSLRLDSDKTIASMNDQYTQCSFKDDTSMIDAAELEAYDEEPSKDYLQNNSNLLDTEGGGMSLVQSNDKSLSLEWEQIQDLSQSIIGFVRPSFWRKYYILGIFLFGNIFLAAWDYSFWKVLVNNPYVIATSVVLLITQMLFAYRLDKEYEQGLELIRDQEASLYFYQSPFVLRALSQEWLMNAVLFGLVTYGLYLYTKH